MSTSEACLRSITEKDGAGASPLRKDPNERTASGESACPPTLGMVHEDRLLGRSLKALIWVQRWLPTSLEIAGDTAWPPEGVTPDF